MGLIGISKGVFAFLGEDDTMEEGWGANQGFVATDAGVVVIDTGFTMGRAEGLRGAIRQETSAPIKLVVNTHDHSDHVFGNSVFADDDPLIVSHSWCRKRLHRLGPRRLAGYTKVQGMASRLKGLTILEPQAVFDRGFELTLGGVRFALIHPRGAHTLGDTMVYLPEQKVLFAGDVLWKDYHPNLEDADITGWLTALKELSRMDVKQVVPGHGPVTDPGSAQVLANYISRFDHLVNEAVSRGSPLGDVEKDIMQPDNESWKLRMIVRRNLDILSPRYRKMQH